MYRIKAFSNAEEFNEIFGKTTHGNGVVSRKNKILLAFYKSKAVWDYCRERNDWRWLSITNMQDLKNRVLDVIDAQSHHNCYNGWNGFWIMGRFFFASKKYMLDNDGICLDGSSAELGFIRYRNTERRNKVYKMSAGKFFNHLITATDFGSKVLPQQVVVWLCEQLVEQWRAYVAERCPAYTLHIGDDVDDFERIYDEDDACDGKDFCSCMVNEGFHTFYTDAVDKCRAAWLEDADGIVKARCVIYDNVKDEDDKVWRLAERQYSVNGDDLLKRQLVNALIKAGEIDGFKQIGAGCGDSKSFVTNEGDSLRDKKFRINCHLEHGDTVSYQDSFKWHDINKQVAYNYSACGASCELDITCGRYQGNSEYDEYHDEWVDETRTVCYQGNEIQCDIERLDDFANYNGDYFHEDDFVTCDECGEEFPNPELYSWANRDAEYSELTECWYCDEDCRERAEERYKESYWHYSDIDDEYVEDENDLTSVLIWHTYYQKYVVGKVITKNIRWHINRGNLYWHNGVLVDDPMPMIEADIACQKLEQAYNEIKLQTA